MDTLEYRFEKAVEKANASKNTEKSISNQVLLELYSYFKQSTIGDNETEKPSFINVKQRAKWDSWKRKEGLLDRAAMREYIRLVDEHF